MSTANTRHLMHMGHVKHFLQWLSSKRHPHTTSDQNIGAHLLITIGANARRLVVFGAIVVGTVVERAVPLPDRSPAPLIHEMPVEANERPMLVAFVLQKGGTLFHSEFFQISAKRHGFYYTIRRPRSSSILLAYSRPLYSRVMIRFFRLRCQLVLLLIRRHFCRTHILTQWKWRRRQLTVIFVLMNFRYCQQEFLEQ